LALPPGLEFTGLLSVLVAVEGEPERLNVTLSLGKCDILPFQRWEAKKEWIPPVPAL
jgi:hypothetical protein